MPLTSLEPAPNFSMVAQASRAHAEQVLSPQDLPSALHRALRVSREEKRQVLLDLQVAVSAQHSWIGSIPPAVCERFILGSV